MEKQTMATWNFDPTHTAANFSARHMMVTTVRGSISGVSGQLELDIENPAAASMEVQLDARTIFTGVEDRDNHLRSADFLDVENYPTITFKSTKVEVTGDAEGKIYGDLTIRNVTKPVVLSTEFLGQEVNPWGKTVIGFEAETKINREDFGLVWNVALESGGVLVGKDIKLHINAEAILVTETEVVAAQV
jgi:polyisoprenoid-binding protein YceI